jgi:hypothetical protein
MTIYVYVHDKYGNPGPYLTTLEDFSSDLAELSKETGYTYNLYGSNIDDEIIDDDNDVILRKANKEELKTVYNPKQYQL